MKKLLTILFAVALGLNLSAQVPDYVPTEGLVAWYPFNGNANDESGNGFNGDAHNTIATIDRNGFEDAALKFNGIEGDNGSTVVIDHLMLNIGQEEYTIHLWFRPANISQISRALFNTIPHTGIAMSFNNNNSPSYVSYLLGPADAMWNYYYVHGPFNDYQTTDWYALTLTKQGADYKKYINGVLESAFSAPLSENYDHDVAFRISGISADWQIFDGDIDDVGFWNRALTEEEILALYNADPPISGCTDSTSCNFDSEATSDDGSCIYPPFVDLGEDIATCDDSVFLDAGEGFTYYEWNTGDTSRSIVVQEAGEYSVITSNTVPNEYALQFNGIDASAQFEESILFGVESFSVSVDCRLNAFAGNDSEPYSYIIGHPLTEGTNDHGFKIQTASNSLNGGFQVHINDEGTTHFNVISFDNSVESKVELDQWYDLTMVVDRDNALFSFYVDGVLVEAQTIHSDFGNLDHPNGLSLGIQSIHQTSLLNGYLDNLQVWELALSEEQVAQFQTTVPSGNEEELVGFWDFEEGEGNEANEVNGSASSILLNNVGWTDDDLHSMFDFSCSAEDSIQVSFLVTGCVNPEACNYVEDALCDDGSCIPSGCMETEACNFNELAECEGEACDYTCCPGPGCCSVGMFWDYDLEQCLNYETCQEDLDGDGVIGINDLMQLLSSFGTMCPIWMCGDPVNYHGYDYATVQIGEQCWFTENLRTTHYANGDSLQGELSDDEWSSANATSIGAQAILFNDIANLDAYGRLYNGHAAVDSRGLCPSGWNVPTDGEFMMLEMELGMSESEANSDGWRGTDQGTQMKASLEDSPAWNGTNSRGFTGLPGGKRSNAGNFDPPGNVGYWWSSTQIGGQAWFRQLQSGRSNIDRDYPDLRYGFSIRCLKDTE